MAKIFSFTCNPYGECCYLVTDDEGNAVVIDPGFLSEQETLALGDALKKTSSSLRAVLLTHAHFDHIYGVGACVRDYGVPIYMHPAEKVVLEGENEFATRCGMPVPDTSWPWLPAEGGKTLQFGSLSFEVLETPGHSPGSVSYLLRSEKTLFSGDTLFRGTIGNTQLPWADYDAEIKSVMDVIMALDADIEVLPGHGAPTSISHERTSNPFLQPFNYKDPDTGYVDGIEV